MKMKPKNATFYLPFDIIKMIEKAAKLGRKSKSAIVAEVVKKVYK